MSTFVYSVGKLHPEVIHDLTLTPQKMKRESFVMPARMGRHQVREDASETSR
jgi:hypothetical protein